MFLRPKSSPAFVLLTVNDLTLVLKVVVKAFHYYGRTDDDTEYGNRYHR